VELLRWGGLLQEGGAWGVGRLLRWGDMLPVGRGDWGCGGGGGFWGKMDEFRIAAAVGAGVRETGQDAVARAAPQRPLPAVSASLTLLPYDPISIPPLRPFPRATQFSPSALSPKPLNSLPSPLSPKPLLP
jgi:hypothetical protein